MQYINKAEILGRVGDVRTNKVGENMVANLKVVTERIYISKDGKTVTEKTWHLVTVWDNVGGPGIGEIKVGDIVQAIGPIFYRKYVNIDNQERFSTEIHASSFKVFPSGTSSDEISLLEEEEAAPQE